MLHRPSLLLTGGAKGWGSGNPGNTEHGEVVPGHGLERS